MIDRAPRVNTLDVDIKETGSHRSPRHKALYEKLDSVMKYLIQSNLNSTLLIRSVQAKVPLIASVLLLALSVAPTHAQDCPAENQFARSLVTTFLTENQFSDNRQETETTRIDTSQVYRVQDVSVCRSLNDRYGNLDVEIRDVVYYQASDRYFVAVPFEKTNDGTTAVGIEFLIVLDKSLNELNKYGL